MVSDMVSVVVSTVMSGRKVIYRSYTLHATQIFSSGRDISGGRFNVR